MLWHSGSASSSVLGEGGGPDLPPHPGHPRGVAPTGESGGCEMPLVFVAVALEGLGGEVCVGKDALDIVQGLQLVHEAEGLEGALFV